VTQVQVVNPTARISFRTPTAVVGEALVVRWIDACNRRDLGQMLGCLSEEVVLHPLKLPGLRAVYRGHEGAMEWLADIEHRHHGHRIFISGLRRVGDEVLAFGSLGLAGGAEVGSFYGLHRVAGARVHAVHHCLRDPDMIERLGLIP
jgi:SnoaL-like domain